jgi:kynurenine formamidase
MSSSVPSRPLLSVGVVALLACGPSAADPPASGTSPDRLDLLFSGQMEVVDLTHGISSDVPSWPGAPGSPFSYDVLISHPDGTPMMGAYHIPEHFGTHLDAPIHGGEGLPSSDEIPVSQFFAQVVVLDVREQASADADFAATAAVAERWEEAHGRIPSGAVVLLRTGWAARWDEGESYYNAASDGVLHFAGFGESLARFLVEDRDIVGIGIDSGSVDPGDDSDFPVHAIVNGAGKYQLENLADLSLLPESGAYLIVAPIKIKGGSGGQVRVFAVVPSGVAASSGR